MFRDTNLIENPCRGSRDSGETVIWSLCKVPLISALSKTIYGTRSECALCPLGAEMGAENLLSSLCQMLVDVLLSRRNLMICARGMGWVSYESSRKFLSLEMKMEDKMYFGLPCEVLLNLRISVSWIPHTNIHENPSTGSRDTGESIR